MITDRAGCFRIKASASLPEAERRLFRRSVYQISDRQSIARCTMEKRRTPGIGFVFFMTLMTSVCLGAGPSYAGQGKVLVIFSGADSIPLKGGASHRTGYFLSEMAVPVMLLKRAGWQIECASPTGAAPVMDSNSDGRQFFKSDEEYLEAKKIAGSSELKAMKKLSSYTEDRLKGFGGIFVPGGHAPMADLYKDPDLGRILNYFHKNSRPTALICHGPVSLLAAMDGNGWIYKGYSVTAFSDAEEKEAEKSGALGGNVQFYICDALAEAGARIRNAEKLWQGNVVRDRELITGQNPGSGEELAEVFLEALTAGKLSDMKMNGWPPAGGNMAPGRLYDISPSMADWKAGYRTLWIGRRSKDCQQQEFLTRLTEHLNLARKALGPGGLEGYVIFATEDYEIAYGKWKDRESAARSLQSKEGRAAVLDGESFMEKVLFREITEIPPWLVK
jgi:putative intracellular protease/amidase